jgi:hypothetical protein
MGEFRKDALPDPRSYIESQGLKLEGRGKWVTTECRLHGGSDSLRWNLSSGGWVCMACGEHGGDVLAYHMAAHGLEFIEAAKELGAWEEIGHPSASRTPKPLPAGAALEVLAFEALLVAVAAGNVANGVELKEIDKDRLHLAAKRIGTIREAYQ